MQSHVTSYRWSRCRGNQLEEALVAVLFLIVRYVAGKSFPYLLVIADGICSIVFLLFFLGSKSRNNVKLTPEVQRQLFYTEVGNSIGEIS